MDSAMIDQEFRSAVAKFEIQEADTLAQAR